MNFADSETAKFGISKTESSHRNTELYFRIGDLAREFDLTLRTLRFYEDRGLITPKRIGTTRLYNQTDRRRLKLALFGKKAGFSLGEIKQLLELSELEAGYGDRTETVRQMFVAQLQVLKQQKVDLEESIEVLSTSLDDIENFGFDIS